jgi:glycolate oxidase FAD binding subunit
MTAALREILSTLVGPDTLLPAEEVERWRTGPGEGGLPSAVLAPSSEDEVAALLGRASQEGWSVKPAGLGMWLQGGGPSDVTLVVSTRRLRGVHEYEPADLTFTAGAGLSVAELRRNTGTHGQWLPLDPPGGLQGSLGAVVATGVAGPLRHLYGTPRDHVLGLTLVSGDGKILRWGGRVVKNVAGFDVTRLSIGSWGTLGLVTSVSARLFPLPESDLTLLFRAPEVSELLPVARDVALSSMPVAAVELMDPLPARGGGGEQGSPALALRLLGSRAQVEEMSARIGSQLSTQLGVPEEVAGDDSRSFHDEAGAWEEGADLVIRLSLLPSKLPLLLEEAKNLKALFGEDSGAGASLRTSAHVGAGILRVGFWRLNQGGPALDGFASVLGDLRSRLEGMNGSLTVSRGPASLVNELGAWGKQGAEGRLMAGLKARFDPEGVLAPGRLGL